MITRLVAIAFSLFYLAKRTVKLNLFFMVELIQRVARMFFRAFVVGAIIMMWNPKAIWGLPFGIIVGLCSEAEAMTKK